MKGGADAPRAGARSVQPAPPSPGWRRPESAQRPCEQTWDVTLWRTKPERFVRCDKEKLFDAKVDSSGQKSRFRRVSAGGRCQIQVRTPQKQPHAGCRDSNTTEKRERTRNQRSGKTAGKLRHTHFQDNNRTALKGTTALWRKHPKLAARRAAADEKRLMATMLAARASERHPMTDKERGKQSGKSSPGHRIHGSQC